MGTYTKAQLETELTRIKNAVASCRTAIYNKGVTSIPENVTLAELPTYVNQIQCSHPDILLNWIGAGDGNISSHSDVYFDTGILPAYDITFDATLLKPTNNDSMLYGAYDDSVNSNFFIPHYSTYAFWWINRGRGFNWRTGSTLSDISTTFYHFSNTTTFDYTYCNYVHAGSDTYQTVTGSAVNSTTSGYTIYIWARNKGTSVDCKATYGTKLKYLCFFKSGRLIRFYVPVLHWNGTEYIPCLYDKVNDTYSYNLGTGTPNYEATNAYLLDYYYVKANTNNGFSTASNIVESMTLHVGFTTYGSDNSNTQSIFANLDATDEFGVYSNGRSGTGSTQRITFKYSASVEGSIVHYAIIGSQPVDGTRYDVSVVQNISSGGKMFVNNTAYTTDGYQTSSSSNIGKPLYIFGNQLVTANTRCYYAIAQDITKTSGEMWVPLYDNDDSNPIKFYDLRNRTSSRYTGNVDNLGYQLLD